MRNAHGLMEDALCSNETIDIFQDDFKLLANKFSDEAGAATELSIIKEIKSFEYQFCKKKVISCIRFCQKSDIFMRNVMATSFMEDLTFDERIEVSGRSYPNTILLWDYKDMHLFIPLLILESPLEITVFEFKPHDPNILIGKLSYSMSNVLAGTVNGQVILWDLSDYLHPEISKNRKKDHSTPANGETPTLKPSVISALPEPYIIPPVIPPEGFNRKILNSHKNAIQVLEFLPIKVEFERKNRFALIPKEERKPLLEKSHPISFVETSIRNLFD